MFNFFFHSETGLITLFATLGIFAVLIGLAVFLLIKARGG